MDKLQEQARQMLMESPKKLKIVAASPQITKMAEKFFNEADKGGFDGEVELADLADFSVDLFSGDGMERLNDLKNAMQMAAEAASTNRPIVHVVLDVVDVNDYAYFFIGEPREVLAKLKNAITLIPTEPQQH